MESAWETVSETPIVCARVMGSSSLLLTLTETQKTSTTMWRFQYASWTQNANRYEKMSGSLWVRRSAFLWQSVRVTETPTSTHLASLRAKYCG